MNNTYMKVTNWPLTIFLGVCLLSPIFAVGYYQRAHEVEDKITEICRAVKHMQTHSAEKHSYEEWARIIEAEKLEPFKQLSKKEIANNKIQLICNEHLTV